MTLILVEHGTRLALEIAPRAAATDRDRLVHHGPSAILKSEPATLDQN